MPAVRWPRSRFGGARVWASEPLGCLRLGLLRSRGRGVTNIYPELSVVSVIITYGLTVYSGVCPGSTSSRPRLSRVRERSGGRCSVLGRLGHTLGTETRLSPPRAQASGSCRCWGAWLRRDTADLRGTEDRLCVRGRPRETAGHLLLPSRGLCNPGCLHPGTVDIDFHSPVSAGVSRGHWKILEISSDN